MTQSLRSFALSAAAGVVRPICGGQRYLLAGLLALFLVFYFFIAHNLIRQINGDRWASDQQVHILLAHQSHRDPWPLRTDGVTNPLWSWIAARFDPGDDEALFVRGKWVNTAITAGFLVGLTLWAARFLPLLATANLLLSSALAVFLQRCTYFQPEPVYYLLFFVAFLAGCELLRRNPLWLYGVLAAVMAFAYLAKPSTAPLLLVLTGITTLRWAYAWWQHRREDRPPEMTTWHWKRHFAGVALFILVHGLIIAPRAVHSAKVFGNPFHNYHTYFMWFDDQEQGELWGLAHVSAQSLADIPPEERPSLRNYLRTHSAEEFWGRLLNGATAKISSLLLPESRLKKSYFVGLRNSHNPWKYLLTFRGLYLLLPLGLVLALTGVLWSRRRGFPIDPSVGWICLFVFGVFAIYALATGWYHPIARGDRFMLALYTPLVFLLLRAGEFLRQVVATPVANAAYATIHLGMCYLLLTRVVNLVVYPVFQAKFG